MHRSRMGVWWLFVTCLTPAFLSGCLLDRTALGCPVGTSFVADAGCIPSVDGDVPDALVPEDGNVPDAYMPDTDSGPDMPDAGNDAAVDPDAGSDAGMDAAVDPDAGSDAGTDAGRPDAGGFNSCSDETGICLRFENTVGSPSVVGWMININWPRAGGGFIDTGWVNETCVGGIRREDADTTECRFAMPTPPGGAAAGPTTTFMYPVYAGLVTPCNATSCPNYPDGYSVWVNTAVQTYSSESRTGTPLGTIYTIRTAL